MPDCCLAWVGAHQAEHPIGEMTQRVPGLLAVHHEVVAFAHRTGPQRGQVRSRAGLGIPLTPPGLARQNGRQESLLLFRCSEGHEHRRDHLQAERDQPRRARVRGFLLENVLLHGVPAGPAELLGPVHGAPAPLVQPALPGEIIVAAQFAAVEYLVAELCGRRSRRNARTSSRKARSSAVNSRFIDRPAASAVARIDLTIRAAESRGGASRGQANDSAGTIRARGSGGADHRRTPGASGCRWPRRSAKWAPKIAICARKPQEFERAAAELEGKASRCSPPLRSGQCGRAAAPWWKRCWRASAASTCWSITRGRVGARPPKTCRSMPGTRSCGSTPAAYFS